MAKRSADEALPAWQLEAMSKETWALFKKINAAVFPFVHADQFYANLRKCAVSCQLSVVAVAPRSDPRARLRELACVCAAPDANDASTVVIATLAVYASERRHGLGRALVAHVEAGVPTECRRLLVHVQTGNDDAVAFYTKLGFVWRETIADYYRKEVQPRSCEVYVKTLADADATDEQ